MPKAATKPEPTVEPVQVVGAAIPQSQLECIDADCQSRPVRVSRSHWIREAIAEKLSRDQARGRA